MYVDGDRSAGSHSLPVQDQSGEQDGQECVEYALPAGERTYCERMYCTFYPNDDMIDDVVMFECRSYI